MEYTVSFTEKDLEIINAALINMPYKYVAELIKKINDQLNNKEN